MTRLLWAPKQHVGPKARVAHAMAFDSGRQRVVMFGGGSSFSDTWEWDGESWTQVGDLGPKGRTESAMAYDASRQRIVLFGGTAGMSVLADTWEWDGDEWVQMADAGPPARLGHAIVFDDRRSRVMLFGGVKGPDANEHCFNDTWEWDGTEWVQVEDSGPSPRRGHAMAFDGSHGRAVLFGGFDGSKVVGETWEWDGDSWTQMSNFGPFPCVHATMIYNGQRSLLFGGVSDLSHAPEIFGHTWEWDGKHWTIRQDLGPGPRWGHAMVYDKTRTRAVLFGGSSSPSIANQMFGDTWEQFSDGAAPSASTASQPLTISLNVTPLKPIEAQSFELRVELSAAAPVGSELTLSLLDSEGNNLMPNFSLKIPKGVPLSFPIPLILPAGDYSAIVKLGNASKTVAIQVSVLQSPKAKALTLTPNTVEVDVITDLTANLEFDGPASTELTVPLIIEADGKKFFIGQPVVVQPGQASGTITFEFSAVATLSAKVSASLGGITVSAPLAAG